MTPITALSNSYTRSLPPMRYGVLPASLAMPSRPSCCSTVDAPAPGAIVHVIHPDEQAAATVERLCASAGIDARSYATLAAFMHADRPNAPGCLVIHVLRPLAGELDFLAHFHWEDARLPMIVTTERADVRSAVLAMKAGAIDFLEMPLHDQDLLEAMGTAIRADQARWQAEADRAELVGRFSKLTRRERQVMSLVTQGRLNKQVAGDLGLSEITVKVHRGSAMRKMAARTLADLVRMADALAGWCDPDEQAV